MSLIKESMIPAQPPLLLLFPPLLLLFPPAVAQPPLRSCSSAFAQPAFAPEEQNVYSLHKLKCLRSARSGMSHRAPDGARCLFGAVGYKHLAPTEPYARNIWLLRSLSLETSGSYGASLVPERLE